MIVKIAAFFRHLSRSWKQYLQLHGSLVDRVQVEMAARISKTVLCFDRMLPENHVSNFAVHADSRIK